MAGRPKMARDGPQTDRLTPRQERLLSALMGASTLKAAAETAGIPYRSAKRMMYAPNFEKAYRECLDTALSDAVRKAQAGMTGALSALSDIAEDPEQPATARVSAAAKLVELGLKLAEIGDISRRLTALEESKGDDLFGGL